MDPLTQLDLLAPTLGQVVAGITPANLDNPTPCAEFSVRGVLEHMVGGATMFAAASRRAHANPRPHRPDCGLGPALGDLAGTIHTPGALDQIVAAPFGSVSGDTFTRFVVLDGLIRLGPRHCYRPAPTIPRTNSSPKHTPSPRRPLTALRDGDTFADTVEPPAGASAIEQLAAFTGRTVIGAN